MSSADPRHRPSTGEPGRTGRTDRRPRRRWIWSAAILVALSAYAIVTFLDVWYASTSDYEPRAFGAGVERAAVVLGAAQYNGEPSPVLRARLDEAARLYENGEVDLVVVTGGRQEADITTEAKTGYDYLRESGIPDGQLRLEVQGASTYESLAATARFLQVDGVTDVVLVTDRYHARRSSLIASEVGLRPVVALTPQSPSLARLARESLAVGIGRVIGFRRLDRL
jgi:vancomycin permeability regulator SanA